ncbi:U32 family peptidase [Rheinheimera hassiensis]|uniref:U32 family peptidase n=1 Tax=Rheinheimera hassiensis TaxID=1193627 RepID=UPI001F066911
MSDPGVVYLLKQQFPHIALHLSVQTNTVNWAAVKFWQAQGACTLRRHKPQDTQNYDTSHSVGQQLLVGELRDKQDKEVLLAPGACYQLKVKLRCVPDRLYCVESWQLSCRIRAGVLLLPFWCSRVC